MNKRDTDAVCAAAILQAVVHPLAQDSTGSLWGANGDGLVRFEGDPVSPQSRHGGPGGGTEGRGQVHHDPASERIDAWRLPLAHLALRAQAAAQALIPSLARTAEGTVWAGPMSEGLGEQPADGFMGTTARSRPGQARRLSGRSAPACGPTCRRSAAPGPAAAA